MCRHEMSRFDVERGRWRVRCDGCGEEGGWRESAPSALAAWEKEHGRRNVAAAIRRSREALWRR